MDCTHVHLVLFWSHFTLHLDSKTVGVRVCEDSIWTLRLCVCICVCDDPSGLLDCLCACVWRSIWTLRLWVCVVWRLYLNSKTCVCVCEYVCVRACVRVCVCDDPSRLLDCGCACVGVCDDPSGLFDCGCACVCDDSIWTLRLWVCVCAWRAIWTLRLWVCVCVTTQSEL